mmetsp:Transcript_79458/g.145376  ORF Transcript_79458/g.145376 Transcript_79458/m.145376 type:complete len:111 (+) Transcript_79458:102-434(+)
MCVDEHDTAAQGASFGGMSLSECRDRCTRAKNCGAFRHLTNAQLDEPISICKLFATMQLPYVKTRSIYKSKCYSNCRRVERRATNSKEAMIKRMQDLASTQKRMFAQVNS